MEKGASHNVFLDSQGLWYQLGQERGRQREREPQPRRWRPAGPGHPSSPPEPSKAQALQRRAPNGSEYRVSSPITDPGPGRQPAPRFPVMRRGTANPPSQVRPCSEVPSVVGWILQLLPRASLRRPLPASQLDFPGLPWLTELQPQQSCLTQRVKPGSCLGAFARTSPWPGARPSDRNS